MGLFGRFLEISLPVNDILESLSWYKQLGFSECPVGDIIDHHYAVVTDGRVFIGLHSAGIDALTLSFVRENVRAHLAELEALGLETEGVYQGEEKFHEVLLEAPDGVPARLLEARTFSAVAGDDIPLTGQLRFLELRSGKTTESGQFWAAGGFDLHDLNEAPEEEAAEEGDTFDELFDDEQEISEQHLELLTPGLTVQLTPGKRGQRLHLYCADTVSLEEALVKHDIPYRKKQGTFGLQSPEGTRFIING